MLLQKSTAQLPDVGPADPESLQWPSTASSGRRLIMIFGGWYGCFLPSCELGSWFIPSPFLLLRSMTASAASRYNWEVAQNRKQLLRAGPLLHIDLPRSNPTRRLLNFKVLTSPRTKFALTVNRNLNADGGGAQVGNVAKELDRRLTIPGFHFSIGRTHPAE